MSGNKKYLFAIIPILLIILIYIIFRNGPKQISSKDTTGDMNTEEVSKSFPLGLPGGGGTMDSSIFDGENLPNYNEFTEKLATGEINFVWELWKLRSVCPEDYKADQCNELLLTHIDKSYSPPDNEQLKSLFKDYFRYESLLRETEFSSDLKFTEKYELLKKKRSEIFKEDQIKLIFGMEESQVDFLNAQKEYLESSKKLKGDDRVKGYEQLKKKTLGNYYNSIVSREDPYQNYSMELVLREAELSKLASESKDNYLATLEEKYFGKEGAQRIQKARDEIRNQDSKIQDYEKKSQEFLSLNPGLPEAERNEKLKELRVKLLGEEDAKAYQRIKDLEEDLKKVK